MIYFECNLWVFAPELLVMDMPTKARFPHTQIADSAEKFLLNWFVYGALHSTIFLSNVCHSQLTPVESV